MKGRIVNIQKFSIHDGPGIRTTVFLKGCPLRCRWCHNPESVAAFPQVLYEEKKCLHCGACAAVCTRGNHVLGEQGHGFTRKDCEGCLRCAEVCPAGALEGVGKRMSAEEVLAEVLQDRVFYESSGGGMTLSGGEPMSQASFCEELLRMAKEKGLHTCMETCGYAPWESFARLAPLVDLFLYDYKLTDPLLHREYTGVSNERILENLRRLDDLGATIVLRCPLIPGVNDTPEHFQGIARTANALRHLQEVHVEPYHPMGEDKARRLGEAYSHNDRSFPSEQRVAEWVQSLQKIIEVRVRKP